MQQTAPTTSPPPGASTSASANAGPGASRGASSAHENRRGADTGKRRRSDFSEAPLPPLPAGPTGPPLAPGPLRGDASVAQIRAAPLTPTDSLRDQGVLGLQLRQQGTGAELRLRWGQGDGVVQATLKETARGVEIQLAAGPDQQRLLHRVAETLASGRGANGFELDGVDVDMDADLDAHARADLRGDSNQPRHRAPGDTPTDTPDDDDPVRTLRRRARRARHRPTASLLPAGAGTSYCR